MITEDYVSFEVAKLLKEKGFDIPLNYFYNSDGRKCYATSYNWNQTTGDFQDYSCPTLQMAMKWLREVHKIEIYPYHQNSETCTNWWFEIENYQSLVNEYESNAIYATYEEAVEAGIRYCLEMLVK